MSSSKKSSRSVERIKHLFLSTESPSRDGEVGLNWKIRAPDQLELPIGFDEAPEEGRIGSRSDLSGPGRDCPPVTLLDFLVDDEVADETE